MRMQRSTLQLYFLPREERDTDTDTGYFCRVGVKRNASANAVGPWQA